MYEIQKKSRISHRNAIASSRPGPCTRRHTLGLGALALALSAAIAGPASAGSTLQGSTLQGSTLQGSTLQGSTLQGSTLQVIMPRASAQPMPLRRGRLTLACHAARGRASMLMSNRSCSFSVASGK